MSRCPLALLGWALGSLFLGQAAGAEPTHLGPIADLSYSPSATLSVSQAGVLRESSSGERLWIHPPFRPFAAATQQGGVWIAGGTPARSGELGFFVDANLRFRTRLAEDVLTEIDVSASQSRLAVSAMNGNVWLASGADALNTLPEFGAPVFQHNGAVRALAFSPDERWLASAGRDGLIALISLVEPELRLTITDHGAGVESLAFHPTDGALVSGARDGKIRRHGIDGKAQRIDHPTAQNDPWSPAEHILSLAWSETHGAFLAGTSGGTLWRLPQGSAPPIALPTPETGPIYGIVTTPDGVTLGRDNVLESLAADAAASGSSSPGF